MRVHTRFRARSCVFATLVYICSNFCARTSLAQSNDWPLTRNDHLRRVSFLNEDGDIYVESSGTGSEIVLQTGKVRVTNGDVYCGISSTEGLAASADALTTKDDEFNSRMNALNDTHADLQGDLNTLDATSLGRFISAEATLASLASTDTSLSAMDASLSSRIDTLNVTDAQLKATDETFKTRVSSLNATDAALKGVDDGLSSRIDALRDIYVNELNVTDTQLTVTDATLGSRIDSLNATQFELKGVDTGLSSRLDALEPSHEEYERIDDEVASLIDSLNTTDATMQAKDASISNRIDALNATHQALSSVDASLAAQIASLKPPKCTEPGGDELLFNGTHWECACMNISYSGETCDYNSQRLPKSIMSGYSDVEFIVSASSELLDHERPVWKAFDGLYGTDGKTWWTSAASRYSGGAYGGSHATTHSKGSVKGEWIQISSSSVAYVLTNVTLWRPDIGCCVDRFPLSFSILGGYDCEAWSLLASFDGIEPPERGGFRQFSWNATSSQAFECFRLVITSLKSGAEGYAELAELAFYGIPEISTKPSPSRTDLWSRSPSYGGRTLPSIATIQSRLQAFQSTCARDVWVADYTLCDTLAWREVEVVDKTDCLDDSTFNTGVCNWWHCYYDGCGPAGDTFYGQSNNWLTVSQYYWLEMGAYSMSFECDDSCAMYLVSADGSSWNQIMHAVTFPIDSEVRFGKARRWLAVTVTVKELTSKKLLSYCVLFSNKTSKMTRPVREEVCVRNENAALCRNDGISCIKNL